MRRPISPTREAPHAVPSSMSGTCPTADPTAAAASHGERRRPRRAAGAWRGGPEGGERVPTGRRSTLHAPHPTTGTSGHQPHTNVSTVTVGGPVPRRCRARPDVVNDARVGERSAGAAASSSRCGLRGGLTERKETDDQRRAQQEDGVFRVGPRVISG